MKRRALVRHLEQNAWLLREGGSHSIDVGPAGRTSTIPRHTEINDSLAKKICKDRGVQEP